MQNYLIKDVQVVNEGRVLHADILISDGRIAKIGQGLSVSNAVVEISGEGKFLFPGVIDDQVHFREPGLTHKATIASEARAAVAGGTTSFMEMPNTSPPALTQELLEAKYQIAASGSIANYSFFMGSSNDNYDEVMRTNEKKESVCGLKIFMGSSTGNMLVDNDLVLDRIFRNSEVLIATHCEDERIIRERYADLKAGKPVLEPADHPLIRPEEACFTSSLKAIQYAQKYGTRLHILHISTARELQLFSNLMPLAEKRITSEVCVHHLHFTSADYERLGYRIKCNPAIKEASNKAALWEGLLDDRLDIIATDHAPHLMKEKEGSYEQAHAGLPLVQHSLQLMLYYHSQGMISLERIAEKMAHAPAICFRIRDRGFIREGYYADLVMVDLNKPFVVSRDNLWYKCGWSPLEDFVFPATILHTFVNGQLAWSEGRHHDNVRGMRLLFH